MTQRASSPALADHEPLTFNLTVSLLAISALLALSAFCAGSKRR